jgi:hypothetical protein
MRRVLFYRAEAPCCSTWGNAGTSYRINEIGKLEDLPLASRARAPLHSFAHGNPRPLQETAGECVVVANCTVHDLQEYSRREMYVKKVS